MDKDVRDSQYPNAESPIVVATGRDMDVRDPQYPNASSPIAVAAGRDMDVRKAHPWNAADSTRSTVDPPLTVFNLIHSANNPSPILTTPSEMIT